MRVLLPAAAVSIVSVLVAGCAQVFGIANTTAAQGSASLTIERVSIGASVVLSAQDLSAQTATFYLPDASDPTVLTAVPGTQADTDVWTARLGGDPLVQFTLPDLPMPIQHLWELPASQLSGPFLAHEHPSPQPPADTSMLDVEVNLPSAYQTTEALQVLAVGAWTTHVLSGTEVPAAGMPAIAATIPYNTFTPATESPVAAIDNDDVVLVLRSVNGQLTGVFQTSFDQTAGIDMVAGSMVAVAADQTFAGPVDPTSVSTRLSAARPSVTTPAVAWNVVAAPGAAVLDAAGPLLNAGTVPDGTTAISAMYGNPFGSLGWDAIATVSLTETRPYTFMGVALTLGATLTMVGEASTLAFDFAAPVPEQVNLDDNQLAIDGATVAIDTSAAHQVTLLSENRAAILYELTLYDLSVNGTTATVQPVLDAISTDTTFTIPPDLFQSGHTYIPAVRSIASGFPNAAAGDLQTRSLPFETAVFEGGVFTVNP